MGPTSEETTEDGEDGPVTVEGHDDHLRELKGVNERLDVLTEVLENKEMGSGGGSMGPINTPPAGKVGGGSKSPSTSFKDLVRTNK